MIVELSVIRDLVAIFGVIAGLSYYILTVRANQKNQRQQLETRQAQLFMQIYNRWASREVSLMEQESLFEWEWDDYEDFIRKYYSDVEARALRSSLGKYWEGIGVLIKRGLIDPYLVDDLMSAQTMSIFEKMLPMIITVRETLGPTAGEWYEYLYNEVKSIYEEQHPELAP